MKTQKEILADLIADTVSQEENKITNFGKEGVLRGLYSSISLAIAEAYNNQVQAKRAAHVQTAVREDLDFIALKEAGLKRRGASKSSVVLLFEGEAGTVIPKGTQIKSNSDSNLFYQTVEDLTLTKNSDLKRPLQDNTLGDTVIAESLNEGSKTRVSPNELQVFATPINGVEAVTNLFPSVGGLEEETDDQFRIRIYNQAELYSHGTQGFYKALAIEADKTVLRSKAVYNHLKGSCDLYLIKNSLASYSETELKAIADYVYSKQRALSPVFVYNGEQTPIEIDIYCSLKKGVDFESLFTKTAIIISDFINPMNLSFGAEIVHYDLLKRVMLIEEFREVTSLLINTLEQNVKATKYGIPVLTKLAIHDLLNDKTTNITQKYMVI